MTSCAPDKAERGVLRLENARALPPLWTLDHTAVFRSWCSTQRAQCGGKGIHKIGWHFSSGEIEIGSALALDLELFLLVPLFSNPLLATLTVRVRVYPKFHRHRLGQLWYFKTRAPALGQPSTPQDSPTSLKVFSPSFLLLLQASARCSCCRCRHSTSTNDLRPQQVLATCPAIAPPLALEGL